MSLLDTLEKHFGKFAIPGLIRYVVGFNALVFLLGLTQPAYLGALTLNRDAILSGEVWRLVSWIFIPNTTSLIWVLFYLMFTWWVGDLIEGTWGTFKLNVYYFLGYLACTIAALVFPGPSLGNTALTTSLLFAAATLAPELQVLLFGIIPLKLKWIAFISAGLLGLSVLGAPWGVLASVLIAFSNYLLFFGPAFFRRSRDAREIAARRAKFQPATVSTLHRCEACGRTEVSNPELEFRVSVDGNEYCTDHLPKRNSA
jgi:Predicted membrane protein